MRNQDIDKLKLADGQSILEIIVAMAIFSLISASLVSLIIGSFSTLNRSVEFAQAEGLADEAVEALKTIRDRDWNQLSMENAVINSSVGTWAIGSSTGELIWDKYFRTINLASVYRDSEGNQVSSTTPGATLDNGSKAVRVRVEWTLDNGSTDWVERTFFLTAWN